MIHTELYRVFYYVGLHKNISKAAKALYITQPAVSKSIKKLEMLSGCTLFLRSSKGVTLTSEGSILFEYVNKAFTELINGEKIIEKLNDMSEGIVKIGISNTLCKCFFLPLLEKFHTKYPGIKIQIINCPSPNTLKLLDEWEIDFGIISIPENRTGYEYTPLMQLQDIFVTGNIDHIEANNLSVSKLLNHPIMMMENGNQTRKYMDEFLYDCGVNITPEIEIGSLDFLIEFAKIGIGVACVIKEFVIDELDEKTLYEIPISPKPQPRQMGIVQKNRLPLSIAAKTFVDFLIDEVE